MRTPSEGTPRPLTLGVRQPGVGPYMLPSAFSAIGADRTDEEPIRFAIAELDLSRIPTRAGVVCMSTSFREFVNDCSVELAEAEVDEAPHCTGLSTCVVRNDETYVAVEMHTGRLSVSEIKEIVLRSSS